MDGPRHARIILHDSDDLSACSHVSGLMARPFPTAGLDGFRRSTPHQRFGLIGPLAASGLTIAVFTDLTII
jgi:hypothetical protein